MRHPDLVLRTVRPYAVNIRHWRMSEKVLVSMARQHPLQAHMHMCPPFKNNSADAQQTTPTALRLPGTPQRGLLWSPRVRGHRSWAGLRTDPALLQKTKSAGISLGSKFVLNTVQVQQLHTRGSSAAPSSCSGYIILAFIFVHILFFKFFLLLVSCKSYRFYSSYSSYLLSFTTSCIGCCPFIAYIILCFLHFKSPVSRFELYVQLFLNLMRLPYRSKHFVNVAFKGCYIYIKLINMLLLWPKHMLGILLHHVSCLLGHHQRVLSSSPRDFT